MKATEACKLTRERDLKIILDQIRTITNHGLTSTYVGQYLETYYSGLRGSYVVSRHWDVISKPEVLKALKKLGYKLTYEKKETKFSIKCIVMRKEKFSIGSDLKRELLS